MMKRILTSFATRSDATLQQLRGAFEASDWTKLRREAHSLKGACGYIASERLRASALALQFAAEESGEGKTSTPSTEECLQRVEADVALVLAAISQQLGGGSGS